MWVRLDHDLTVTGIIIDRICSFTYNSCIIAGYIGKYSVWILFIYFLDHVFAIDGTSTTQ